MPGFGPKITTQCVECVLNMSEKCPCIDAQNKHAFHTICTNFGAWKNGHGGAIVNAWVIQIYVELKLDII